MAKERLMPGKALQLHLTPGNNDFTLCSSMVEEFCERHDLPQKIIFKIVLVLDELITNIVSYGYDTPGNYSIDVNLTLGDGWLLLMVQDDARPFNPLRDAAEPELDVPLEQRKRPIGGMGVHLVKSLMDYATYERVAGKNVLTLKKNLAECSPDQGKKN